MRNGHRPPSRCPVCSDTLTVTRLQCPSCATELSGLFDSCEFCAISNEQRDLLRAFLTARGNLKEVERHLGVSYPTARARVAELLTALGLDSPPGERPLDVLQALARGDIDVDEALGRLDS